MFERVPHRYWWMFGVAALWGLFFQVRATLSFSPPKIMMREMSFYTSTGQSSQVYQYTFLPANWYQAPQVITDEPEKEVLERKLPYCHSFQEHDQHITESACSHQDTQKFFWGKPEEYVWRNGNKEIRLIPDTSSARAPSTFHDLIISEVSWAGSYDKENSLPTDEWLELYNPTEQVWNLRGLRIEGVRSNGAVLVMQQDHYVGPYSYFIIGKSTGSQTLLRFEPDSVFSTLTISNNRAGIRMLSADGNILDEVPTGEWEAGTNDTGHFQRATAQRHLSKPTSDWSSWFMCSLQQSSCWDTSIGWKENSHHTLGSPWQASLY